MIAYDGTTPLKAQMVALGLVKLKSDDTKQAAVIKVARAALGLPVDTKGGAKTKLSADITNNIAIIEWLTARVAESMSGNDIIKKGRTGIAPAPFDDNASGATEIEYVQPLLDSIDVDSETESTPLATTTTTPSNEIRNVSYLNHLMQVVINDEIILDIKATHALALEFRKVSKMHGRRVGELLLQVKAELKNGEFVPWLESNVGVSVRQAQNYMRDAKGLPAPLRTVEIRNVAYLNPPADLVAQVESPETETLRLENEKLQNELIAVKAAADYATQQVRMDLNTSNHLLSLATVARDDLRANQSAIIDAKVSEQKAIAIQENQQAITEANRDRDNTANELERLKREQVKAIDDGIKRGLHDLDTEISKKQYAIEIHTRDIENLREVENSLNREVGYVQTHQRAIAKIKDNLSFVSVALNDSVETGVTPFDVLNDWQLIDAAIDKLKQDVLQIIDNGKTYNCGAIEGESL